MEKKEREKKLSQICTRIQYKKLNAYGSFLTNFHFAATHIYRVLIKFHYQIKSSTKNGQNTRTKYQITMESRVMYDPCES